MTTFKAKTIHPDAGKVLLNNLYSTKFTLKNFLIELKRTMLSVSDGHTDLQTGGQTQ